MLTVNTISFVPELPSMTVGASLIEIIGAFAIAAAFWAVMLASGADMHQAMRIANRTAGIVVGKLGTAVVTLDELRATL